MRECDGFDELEVGGFDFDAEFFADFTDGAFEG